MKKQIISLLSATVLLFGCAHDELNDIRDAEAARSERIAKIEAWEAGINTQLAELKTAIKNLQEKNYVTSVIPLYDNSGYTVTFKKGESITLKNGKDGVAPVISMEVNPLDGKYYWIVYNKGEKVNTGILVSEEAPKVFVNDEGLWVVKYGEGHEIVTDVYAQEMPMLTADPFEYIQNDCLIVKFNNGFNIKLPIYQGIKVHIGAKDDPMNETMIVNFIEENFIDITVTGEDISKMRMIKAEVMNENGTSIDIASRMALSPLWFVSWMPEVQENPEVTPLNVINRSSTDVIALTQANRKLVLIPTTAGKAMLKITVIDHEGQPISFLRLIRTYGQQINDLIWAEGNVVSYTTADGKKALKFSEDPMALGDNFIFGSLIALNNTAKKTTFTSADVLFDPMETPKTYVDWDEIPFVSPDNGVMDCFTKISNRYDSALAIGDVCSYMSNGLWRMPTKQEYEEMLAATSFVYNATKKVWSLGDDKFLTFANNTLWSSTSGNPVLGSPVAYTLYGTSSALNPNHNESVKSACAVRCVRNYHSID